MLTPEQLPKYVRFSDLVAMGLVTNRVTLHMWIKERNFPPGRLLGVNTRVWRLEDVEAWIATMPSQFGPDRGRQPRHVETEAE